MPIYQAFGAYIESDVPLLDLKPCWGNAPSYYFYQHSSSNPTPAQTDGIEWYDTWTDGDGQIRVLLGKQDSRYLIRFSGLADFWISSDERETVCVPGAAIPAETISHLFLDQVFPCLLSQSTQLMLHAAAVVIEGGAIVFLGETGAGKSTLTSSLCSKGFQLLTDDGLLVVEEAGRFLAIPGYSSVRLWPESLPEIFAGNPPSTDVAHYSEKQRVAAEQAAFSFAMERMPLRGIYLLKPQETDADSEIAITPISPQDAFNECFNSIFRLDFRDRVKLKEQFTMTARMVGATQVFSLNFPHNFSQLAAVHACLLAHLNQNEHE